MDIAKWPLKIVILPILVIVILVGYFSYSSSMPAYLTLLFGVIVTTLLIVAIDASIDIYQKLTINKKLIFNNIEVARYHNYENQGVIQLRCFFINDSYSSIFFNVKDVKYFLFDKTNIKPWVEGDSFLAAKQTQPFLLPIVFGISAANARDKGKIHFLIEYGKDRNRMKYKLDLEVEVTFFCLPEDKNKILMSYLVKNARYL